MISTLSLKPAPSLGRVASDSRPTEPNVARPFPDWVEEEPSPAERSSDANIRQAVLKRKQPSLRGRAARSLIIFCIGVAATLAWQSYGDATREMIASSYPRLGWLAPKTVAVETTAEITSSIAPASTSDSEEKTVAAENPPERTSPIAPAITSDSQEIKAILMAVRQNVDQLAARQQQMANDIATLKATERNLLRNISSAASARPAAAPARKPVPVSSRSPQEPPVR